jgi:hypothetical protein
MTDAQIEKLQARKEKEFRKVILTKKVVSFERVYKNNAHGFVEITYENGSRFYCQGPLVENVGL